MRCTVCNHSQRHDIDQALLAGNATYAALSQQYGLSVSALFRHKKLLKLKMARVEKDLASKLRQGTLFQFNDFLEQTRHLARTASADGNIRQALQAVRAGTRILNFITKLDVHLDQDTVYRVLASPQWATQDSLLPSDPQIITGSHQALADDLFYPCQELPAALEDVLKEEEKSEIALGTRNQQPETFPADEILPKIQREKSAKLPKKPPQSAEELVQYHKDMPCEKIAAQNSPAGRETAAPPAVKPSCPQLGKPPGPALATGNPKPETLTAKLKTFLQKWPKLVSTGNRKLKTTGSPWRVFAFHGPSDHSPSFPEFTEIYTTKDR